MNTYQKWCVALVIITVGFSSLGYAQDNQIAIDFNFCGASAEEISNKTYILEDINEARLKQNFMPLAPNPILCQAAQTHAISLASRNKDDLLNQSLDKRLENGVATGIEEWIARTSYGAYGNNRYAVALFAFVSEVDNPSKIFDQLDKNAHGFLFSPLYRQIGIGYIEHETLGYYIYVLAFGSQPNQLNPIPLDNTTPDTRYKINNDFSSRRILLALPDEQFQPTGDLNVIGNVFSIEISQKPMQPNETPFSTTCTLPETNVQPYSNFVEYFVDGSLGTHTIWVRMCDAVGRMIVMSVDVSIMGEGAVVPPDRANPNVASGDTAATAAALQLTSDALAAQLTAFKQMQEAVVSPTPVIITATPAPIQNISPTPDTNLAMATSLHETAVALGTQQAVFQLTIAAASSTPVVSIGASPIATTPPVTAGTPWLQLNWTPNYLVLTNISGGEISADVLERLGLMSEIEQLNLNSVMNQIENNGEGTPVPVRYNELPPAKCLFLSDGNYKPPENDVLLAATANTCDTIHVRYNGSSAPWLSPAGFTMLNRDTNAILATCTQSNAGVIGGSCRVNQP
jgi:hypothetical protein